MRPAVRQDFWPGVDAPASGSQQHAELSEELSFPNCRSPRAFVSALAVLKPAANLLHTLWLQASTVIAEKRAGPRVRRLRLIETVALGEKRFVAIVQVQGEQFLIGGGATSVSLLTRLQGEPAFASVLAQQAGDTSESASATSGTGQ